MESRAITQLFDNSANVLIWRITGFLFFFTLFFSSLLLIYLLIRRFCDIVVHTHKTEEKTMETMRMQKKIFLGIFFSKFSLKNNKNVVDNKNNKNKSWKWIL